MFLSVFLTILCKPETAGCKRKKKSQENDTLNTQTRINSWKGECTWLHQSQRPTFCFESNGHSEIIVNYLVANTQDGKMYSTSIGFSVKQQWCYLCRSMFKFNIKWEILYRFYMYCLSCDFLLNMFSPFLKVSLLFLFINNKTFLQYL